MSKYNTVKLVSKNGKTYYRSICKSCKRGTSRKPSESCLSQEHKGYYEMVKRGSQNYRNAHIEAARLDSRRWHFKTKYGLTIEDVTKMIQNQHNKCKICGEDFVGKKEPCVDHDHKTNKVRGIICNRCNVLVGLVESGLLPKVIDYLKSVEASKT
jgi:hypothetical protein